VQESEHVFIKAGLSRFLGTKSHLEILEVGFGTGLNALLTYRAAKNYHVHIHYTAIEKYPVAITKALGLNYANGNESDFFKVLHSSEWEKDVEINTGFIIQKIHDDVFNFNASGKFDLVYFDAFGPGKQPEMWIPEIFQMLFRAMKPGSILCTYSAKGEVRRNMLAAGFAVERLPGPPGKREMLRAAKNQLAK
jgi:tRNA U34 5-methylaminomethyl-2-thiouridine-forming methyltransferase MnmC